MMDVELNNDCRDAVRVVLASWFWRGDPTRVDDGQVLGTAYLIAQDDIRILIRAILDELEKIRKRHGEPERHVHVGVRDGIPSSSTVAELVEHIQILAGGRP